MKKKILSFIVAVISFSMISAYAQTTQEQTPKTTYKGERRVSIIDINDIEELNQSRSNQLKNTGDTLRAMYSLPDGYYLTGLNDLFQNYHTELKVPYAFGPAYYSESTWKNLSTAASDYLWRYSDPFGIYDGDTITSKAENLVTHYADVLAIAPILEATGELGTSTYQWGQNAEWNVGYIAHGGIPNSEGEGTIQYYGVTNLDYITYKYAFLNFAPNQYVFGTSSGSEIVSVCEKFSKPTQPYILEDVKIHVMCFNAPARTEFTLIIHRLVDGVPTDTIATATTYSEDMVSNTEGTDHFIYFRNFRVKTATGIIQDFSEIEIKDGVMLEFTGYQGKPGVSLAVVSQHEPAIDGSSTAYVYRVKQNGTRLLVPTYEFLEENVDNKPGVKRKVRTALGFSMIMSYPFIVSEVTKIDFVANPEPQSFRMYSHYPPFGVDEETGETYANFEIEAPEWIKVEAVFDEVNYLVNMTVTAESLPDDVDVRSGVIKITAPASYETIAVEQRRDWTGVEAPEDKSQVSIHKVNGNVEVKYPAAYTKLFVYNINGQFIGTYNLPADGVFNIGHINSKGVILFNLIGEKEHIVKKFIN